MKLDEFESVFKAADKRQFEFQEQTLARLLIVVDLEADELARFVGRVTGFVHKLGHLAQADFTHEVVTKQSYRDLGELLTRAEQFAPGDGGSLRPLDTKTERD